MKDNDTKEKLSQAKITHFERKEIVYSSRRCIGETKIVSISTRNNLSDREAYKIISSFSLD
jgi:hypothetical protein